jgi:DNA polymerase-3 subunit epsilon
MNPEALLDTLLAELNEGVVACEPDGRVMLFNRAAAELLGRDRPLRRGSSIYRHCYRPPLEHALDLLQYRHGSPKEADRLAAVQFLNTAADQDRFFRCRVRFLPPGAGVAGSFVVLFEDISAWHVPGNPLLLKIEQFRAPLANLQAAVENLTEYRDMSPVMRSAFENVLVQESFNLSEAFGLLAGSCRDIMQTRDPLTELASDILSGYIAQHLRQKNIPVAIAPAEGNWIKVDIYGLMQVLDFLADTLAGSQEERSLSCEVGVGEQFIYFDFIWTGPVMPAALVEKMLEQELEDSMKGMTVSTVLRTMDGDIWSQPQGEEKGMLRLALPVAGKGSQEN